MTRVTNMPAATPSPIPIHKLPEEQPSRSAPSSEPLSTATHSIAHGARLRIHFDDLSHPAYARFSRTVPLQHLIQDAISNVQAHLFTPPSATSSRLPQKPISSPWHPQEVRSVTLIFYGFSGVAYTTGTRLDEAHKEIHFSLDHAANNAYKSDADYIHEMLGVITHEMVHCFQHNAKGSCPGGLIEGVSDYVRIKSGLGAQHWKKWPANVKSRGDQWDAGYERTAWFLEWIEERIGSMVGRLNHAMERGEWKDGKLFNDITGKSVDKWWKEYKESWKEMNRKRGCDEEDGVGNNHGDADVSTRD